MLSAADHFFSPSAAAAGPSAGSALLHCRVDRRFGGGKNNSEDFNTCGRTIKTGLIAVGEFGGVQVRLAAFAVGVQLAGRPHALAVGPVQLTHGVARSDVSHIDVPSGCRYRESLDMGR